MIRLALLFLLLLFTKAALSIEAELPTDEKKKKIAQLVSETASTSMADGMASMTEEKLNELAGVESSDTGSNFGGSGTNLSITRSGRASITCGSTNPVSAPGIKVNSATCLTSGNAVTFVHLSWCSVVNGIDCGPNPNLYVGVAPGNTIKSGSITITDMNCTEDTGSPIKCNMAYKVLSVDAFDGSGDSLAKTARDRENANPSFVLDSLEASQKHKLYGEIEKEAQGSKDYMQSSYKQLAEDGEIPVYRNSPEDIDKYGKRTGLIGVDYATNDPKNQCTGTDLTNSQQCVSNYKLTEYVCPQESDIKCEYKRPEKEEICTERLIASCSTKQSCSSNSEGQAKGPISNVQSDKWNVSWSYPTLSTSSPGGNGGLGAGNYIHRIKFNVNRKSNVKSFILKYVDIDDMINIKVNGFRVFALVWSNKGNDHIYQGQANCPPGHLAYGPSPTNILRCSKNDFGGDDYHPNRDVRWALRTGENIIDVLVGVRGSGEYSAQWEVQGYCGCIFNESWEKVCNANSILP